MIEDVMEVRATLHAIHYKEQSEQFFESGGRTSGKHMECP